MSALTPMSRKGRLILSALVIVATVLAIWWMR